MFQSDRHDGLLTDNPAANAGVRKVGETNRSEDVARDIIGHDSAEISRHHTHIDDETKRVAVDKLPDWVAASTEKSQP